MSSLTKDSQTLTQWNWAIYTDPRLSCSLTIWAGFAVYEETQAQTKASNEKLWKSLECQHPYTLWTKNWYSEVQIRCTDWDPAWLRENLQTSHRNLCYPKQYLKIFMLKNAFGCSLRWETCDFIKTLTRTLPKVHGYHWAAVDISQCPAVLWSWSFCRIAQQIRSGTEQWLYMLGDSLESIEQRSPNQEPGGSMSSRVWWFPCSNIPDSTIKCRFSEGEWGNYQTALFRTDFSTPTIII